MAKRIGPPWLESGVEARLLGNTSQAGRLLWLKNQSITLG